MSCERRFPHDRLVTQLIHFAKAAGLTPQLEPTGRCTGDRRPDLAVPDLGTSGRELLLDVTTVDPGVVSHLNRGAHRRYQVGNTAAAAMKNRYYAGHYNPAAYSFLALPVELPGRWSPELFRFFGKVKRFALQHRYPDAEVHSAWVARWRQRICTQFRVSQAISAGSLVADLSS